MKITIAKDKNDAECIAAKLICSQIKKKPQSLLGLATGRTMKSVYQQLIREFRAGRVDFSSISTVNLDEYYGLDKDNINSYHHFMTQRFFNQVNIKKEKIMLLDGKTRSIIKECNKLESFIAQHGGVDLQLLGIGLNGHIGFNEPNSMRYSRTRLTKLSETTHQQNNVLFKDGTNMPSYALTMGLDTILEAKQILLIATGIEKAEIIADAIYNKPSEALPASYLQTHPAATIVLDKEAANYLDKHSCYNIQ